MNCCPSLASSDVSVCATLHSSPEGEEVVGGLTTEPSSSPPPAFPEYELFIPRYQFVTAYVWLAIVLLLKVIIFFNVVIQLLRRLVEMTEPKKKELVETLFDEYNSTLHLKKGLLKKRVCKWCLHGARSSTTHETSRRPSQTRGKKRQPCLSWRRKRVEIRNRIM